MIRSDYEIVTDRDPMTVIDMVRGQIDAITVAGNKVIGITMFRKDLQNEYVGVIWYQTPETVRSLTPTERNLDFENEIKRAGVSNEKSRIEDENVNRAYRESLSHNRRS